MAISGAAFNAARVVERYEETKVPMWVEEDCIEQHVETGWFGDYKVPNSVTTRKFIGNTVKKTPIFKQHVFSKAKLETTKKFLEGKTLDEVKLLYGNSEKRSDDDE